MQAQLTRSKREKTKRKKKPKKDTKVSSAVTGQFEADGSDDQPCQQRLKLAAGLRHLADRLEQQPELLSRAADLMSQDFMDNRAPQPEVASYTMCCSPVFYAWHQCRSQLLLMCLNHLIVYSANGSSQDCCCSTGLCWHLFTAEHIRNGMALHRKMRACFAYVYLVISWDKSVMFLLLHTYIVMPSSHYHHLALVLLFPVLQESLLPAGPEPTMKDYVMCRGQNAFRVVPFEAQEAALSGPLIKVCHLLPCPKAGCKGLREDIRKGQQETGGHQKVWGGGCLRCQSQLVKANAMQRPGDNDQLVAKSRSSGLQTVCCWAACSSLILSREPLHDAAHCCPSP